MFGLGSELHPRMVLRGGRGMVEPCCSSGQACCVLANAKHNTLATNQQGIPRELALLRRTRTGAFRDI